MGSGNAIGSRDPPEASGHVPAPALNSLAYASSATKTRTKNRARVRLAFRQQRAASNRPTTMHGKTIAFLLTAAICQGVCAGEIYRCTAANGDVMYTNIACPDKSSVQHVGSYVPETYSPKEAEALAAEAAAISARQAQEAAERAQAAAYQAAQASYRQPEPEPEMQSADYSPGWIGAYPVYYPRVSRHGDHHEHHHVIVKSNPSMPTHPVGRPAPRAEGVVLRWR